MELERFMVHLSRQDYRNFELILIDQNQDDQVSKIILPYRQDFQIIYIHSQICGASFARNLGLSKATGDIILFPDDDCWFPPELLTSNFTSFPVESRDRWHHWQDHR